MSKKIISEMNRFDYPSKNEVIYLVPCVKKLTASLLHCSSNTHNDKVLKICQTKEGVVNIPSTFLKECNSFKNDITTSQNLGSKNLSELFDCNSGSSVEVDTTSELASNEYLLHDTNSEHLSNTLASSSQNYPFITNTNYMVSIGNCKPDQFCFQGTEVPLLQSVQEEANRMPAENENAICTSVIDKTDDEIHNEIFSCNKYLSNEEFDASPFSGCQEMPDATCLESDMNIQDGIIPAHQSVQSLSSYDKDIEYSENKSKLVEMNFAGPPQDCFFASSSDIPPLNDSVECQDSNFSCNLTESLQDRDIQSSSECNELFKESASDIFDADSIVKDLFSYDMSEINVKNGEKEKTSSYEPSNSNTVSEMSEFEALLLSPLGLDTPSSSDKTLDKTATSMEDLVEYKANLSSSSVKHQPPNSDDLFTFDSIISDVGSILEEYQLTKDGSPSSIIMDNKVQNYISPSTSFKDPPSHDRVSHFSAVSSYSHSMNKTAVEGSVKIKNGNIPSINQDPITTVVDNSVKFCNSERLFDELLHPEEKYGSKMESINRTSETLNRCFSENTCHKITPVPSSSSEVIKSNPQIPGIPTKVAFKVRPAGKPGKYHDRGKMLDKSVQPTSKVSVGGRNRRAKNHFSYRQMGEKCDEGDHRKFTWELDKNNVRKYDDCRESCFSSLLSYNKQRLPQGCSELSLNDFLVGSYTAKQDTSDIIEPNTKSDHCTDMPNTMQTSVIYKPNVINVYKAQDKSSVISYTQDSFASRLVSSSPNIQLTNSSPSTSSSAMQYSHQDIMKINLPVTSASDATVKLPSDSAVAVKSSFITLHKGGLNNYGVAFPRRTPSMPVCMRTSIASCSENEVVLNKSMPVCNKMMTTPDNGNNKISSTPQSVSVENPNSVNCQQVKIDVLQVASKMSNIKNASSSRESIGNEGKFPEPIKITVRTKPVDLSAEKTSHSITQEDNLVLMEALSTDASRNIHVSDSNLKSSQDSMKKIPRNKNWSHELKAHFPNVPESILQQLTIPPQALHRGYLTTNDLQNIRTQALKVHLGILYRNHVSKCTTCRCEICHTFVVQQGSLSWTAREKLFKMNKKPGKSAKSGQSRFKTKKRGRRCSRKSLPNGEKDDPTYEPPLSYFNAWKRKSNWYNDYQMKMPRVPNTFATGNMPECYMLLNNIWQVENNNKKNGTFTRHPVPKYNSCQTGDEYISNYNRQDEDNLVEQDSEYQVKIGKCDLGQTEQYSEAAPVDLQISRGSEVVNMGMTSTASSVTDFGADCNNSWSCQEWLKPYKNLDSNTCEVTKEEHAFNNNNTTSGIAYYTSMPSIESQTVLHSHPLNDSMTLPSTMYVEEGCTFSGSCRIMECSCARAGVNCNASQCSCKSCDNPLNILLEFAVDVHTARLDECLMQNLYKYNTEDLRKLLSSDITVPCCMAVVKLQHIIPSTVICNCCGSAVSYSWCMHSIYIQNMLPRNHCLVCCSCKPSYDTHCQVCKLCTPSTNQGTCSECGTSKLFAA